MPRTDGKLDLLRRLLPTENGVTVFDAETQETSYGIWILDGLPLIFDTHRKSGHFLATIEMLTEVVTPVRIKAARVKRFCAACRAVGLLPIPYSGCFFRGNLHVYPFSGPVRGFDIAAAGRSVIAAERSLSDGIARLWPRIPDELGEAQRGLLAGTREVRHPEDLEVLVEHRTAERRRNPR